MPSVLKTTIAGAVALGAFGLLMAENLAGTDVAPVEGGSAPLASRSPQMPAPMPSLGNVVLLEADRRGHYVVEARIEGFGVSVMVDTGASVVALRESDARRAGVSDRAGRMATVSTANGIVEVRAVTIREIRIEGIVARDVEAVIMPDSRLGTNLLGMSFLNKLRGFDVSGGRLALRG